MWRQANSGHSKILAEMTKIGGDTKSLKNFREGIRMDIPPREGWKQKPATEKRETTVYTDASVTRKGTGIGIYLEELNLHESFRLKDSSSVVEAEVCAIREAAKLIQKRGEPKGDVTIQDDS